MKREPRIRYVLFGCDGVLVEGDEFHAIDGVRGFLDEMPLPKSVTSGCHPDLLTLKLERAGLKDHFPGAIFSAHSVKHPPPAPDLFFYAIEKMGWNPEECLVVASDTTGIEAARAADLRVCGFLGARGLPENHQQKLLEAGADAVIPRMDDLRAFLR